MIIELILRMLTGFFSKAGGMLLIGFFAGSFVVVGWDDYMGFIEFISIWFVEFINKILGI